MVYTTLAEILIAKWLSANCTQGTINDNDIEDYHDIYYGITYSTTHLGLGELGFGREIADNMTGDTYMLRIMGESRSEVNDQLKELQRICIKYRGEQTDIYRKLYLPNLAAMSYKHENDYTREGEWRFLEVPLLASRVGESNTS